MSHDDTTPHSPLTDQAVHQRRYARVRAQLAEIAATLSIPKMVKAAELLALKREHQTLSDALPDGRRAYDRHARRRLRTTIAAIQVNESDQARGRARIGSDSEPLLAEVSHLRHTRARLIPQMFELHRRAIEERITIETRDWLRKTIGSQATSDENHAPRFGQRVLAARRYAVRGHLPPAAQ